MSLHIIKPGIYTTVQDIGRNGYQAQGIGVGGAMDTLAAALANCIVGNDVTEAVIEMSFPAPLIEFYQPAIIVIAGADFSPSLNGVLIQNCKPFTVQAGDILSFDKKIWGAWAYLAIQGGFALQQWLDSYATHVAAGTGGFMGRALQKEDVLEYKKATSPGRQNFNWQLAKKEWQQWYAADNTIQVLPGNELNLLTGASKEKLFTESFAVTQQSNRMGYRLQGIPLQLQKPVELTSSAVTKGTIQLLPAGECIVLMADCQTTGGYPRIAHIISTSIPTIAQAQWATHLQFSLTNINFAEYSLLAMQQWLLQVKQSCAEKYNGTD